ncbi:MAG: hypothetical protein E7164_00155 [Firmicutes bacterium]|nr:hypothetical protein [Bacillota bacterium]
MNSFLYLKIEGYSSQKIIQKLTGINVSVFDVQENDNIVYVKILANDIEKIQKYLRMLEFKKVKYTGKEYFKKTFKRYRILFIGMILSFAFVAFASNIIVDIDVIHEDENLVTLVLDELNQHGIKKFGFRKDYQQLEIIKDEIKNKHLDKIDWLEINKVGMRYVVRIEERILTKKENIKEYCHLYSTKDALITKVKVFNGEAVININDYVKQGTLLVSGDIKLNEEIVNQVCASGSVYAEVWYDVNLKIPLDYYEETPTGKERNNLIINYDGVDHQIFKDRLKSYQEKRKLIFDLLGVKIYLKKEEEVIKKLKTYTEKEAIEKAIKLATEKVEIKLKDSDKIISQKILQNTIIDSTMDIDIFIVAEEEISKQVVTRKDAENGL